MTSPLFRPTTWNIANLLSLVRIAVVPVLVACLLLIEDRHVSHGWFEWTTGHPINPRDEWLCYLAAWIFILASITDFFDGYLARRYQLVTSLGKFLDPMADKLMVITAMVMLVEMGRFPAWAVALTICREIAVTGLRAIAVEEGIVIAASNLGKKKTVLQIVALSGGLIFYPVNFFLPGAHEVNAYAIGMVFFYASLVYALWSGWDYFRAFWSSAVKA